VINAQGRISYSPFRLGYDELQKVLLQAEGIPFDAEGRVDLQQFGWDPRQT
jgi:methylated-DNA-protein-cysteine methyltransferase-like protein